MFIWIMENSATIIISAVLALVTVAVIAGMVRSKREGKSSCGCGCAGCPAGSSCGMDSACHPKSKSKK